MKWLLIGIRIRSIMVLEKPSVGDDLFADKPKPFRAYFSRALEEVCDSYKARIKAQSQILLLRAWTTKLSRDTYDE